MSVKLSCERKRKLGVADKDYLAVTATIKKSERGGVQLHDAQVRLRSAVQQEAPALGPIELYTIQRVNRTDLLPGSAEHPPPRPD